LRAKKKTRRMDPKGRGARASAKKGENQCGAVRTAVEKVGGGDGIQGRRYERGEKSSRMGKSKGSVGGRTEKGGKGAVDNLRRTELEDRQKSGTEQQGKKVDEKGPDGKGREGGKRFRGTEGGRN